MVVPVSMAVAAFPLKRHWEGTKLASSTSSSKVSVTASMRPSASRSCRTAELSCGNIPSQVPVVVCVTPVSTVLPAKSSYVAAGVNTPAGKVPSLTVPPRVMVTVVPSALRVRVVAVAVAVVAVAKEPISVMMSASEPVMLPLPAARALLVFAPMSAAEIDAALSASSNTRVMVSPAPAPLLPTSDSVTLESWGDVASLLNET